MAKDPLLDEGIDLFNDGKYFEAHEVWEDLWRSAEEPPRKFYQGLIHAAVGLHHLRRKNVTGARSQLEKSMKNLRNFPPICCGIDNAALISKLGKVLENLQVQDIRITRVES